MTTWGFVCFSHPPKPALSRDEAPDLELALIHKDKFVKVIRVPLKHMTSTYNFE